MKEQKIEEKGIGTNTSAVGVYVHAASLRSSLTTKLRKVSRSFKYTYLQSERDKTVILMPYLPSEAATTIRSSKLN